MSILHVNDTKACTDADGAYGLIFRLINDAKLDPVVIDVMLTELDDCVNEAREKEMTSDEALINISSDKFDKESMVFGMILSAYYIRGVLNKHTRDFDNQQIDEAMSSDPRLN